jgi:hypothetical protein
MKIIEKGKDVRVKTVVTGTVLRSANPKEPEEDQYYVIEVGKVYARPADVEELSEAEALPLDVLHDRVEALKANPTTENIDAVTKAYEDVKKALPNRK